MTLTIIVIFLISILIYHIIFKYEFFPKIFLDFPDQIRKKHILPVPKLGIIFLIPFFILFDFSNSSFEYNVHFLVFCLIFILIGILDDILTIKWTVRIFFEVSSILAYLLLNQELLLNELHIDNLNLKYLIYDNFYFLLFFTCFCFVSLVNALNFYDGINNQLSNYLIILFVFFFLETTNYLFLVLIISIIIFSLFNFYNKVFFGSASIYLLSFLIFNFSTFYHNKNIIEADTIFLMLLYPGIDLIRLFFSRLSRKKSPFKGDRDHIHHILESKFNQKQIVWVNNIPIFVALIISQTSHIGNLYSIIFTIFYYIMLLNLYKKS